MRKPTYKQLNEGSRYIVTREFYNGDKYCWRIWDRQEKKFERVTTYTAKRTAQNVADLLNIG